MNPDQPPTGDDPAQARGMDDAGKSERGLAGVIKSAKRVLELFEYFAECRRPLTVGDVVKGLDYPQSSVSALMKSLTRLGYLDYNRHDRLYTPTLRVALFGGWIHDQVYSENTLSGVVDDLYRRSDGHTVLIGMQNDVYVQYIHLVQAPAPQIPWYIKPGSLRPLCRSASGRILLSLKTDVEVQQLLWRINAEEEVFNRMTVRDLLHELNLIRLHGYAFTLGTTNPHTGVISVQLPTPPGQPPMALGIGGPIPDIERRKDELLELLREAVAPYQQRLKLASGAATAPRAPRR
jgi:DNA-binding IclR family transcriptional regulator